MASIVHRVTFYTDALRFPTRCLDCGGAPDGSGELTHKLGPVRLTLPAPFCKRCASARSRRRLLWHLANLGLMGAWLAAVMVLQDRVPRQSPVMPILVVTGTIYMFAWYVLETRLYHQWYSRIWIATFEHAKPGTVTLASKDEALLKSVAEGGGVVEGNAGAAG